MGEVGEGTEVSVAEDLEEAVSAAVSEGEEDFQEVVAVDTGNFESLKKLGENLVCVAQYGLRGKDGKFPKAVAVLSRFEEKDVEKIRGALPREKISFLTIEELKRARDSLPLFFLEILNNYEIVFGKDDFKNLKITKKNADRHLEQELRLKLIQLRQALIYSDKKEIFNSSPEALSPVLAGLLFLKNRKAEFFRDALKIVEKDYETGTVLYGSVYFSSSNEKEAVSELLRFLSKLVRSVDENSL